MLLFVPNPLQMIIHLRVQPPPLIARKAKGRVIAAHPTLDRIVQVQSCFGFLPQVLDFCTFPGVALLQLVEAHEGGCPEEVAEDAFAAGSEEAG